MAPIIRESRKSNFSVEVCITSQHREMIDSLLSLFDISEDYNLDVDSSSLGLAALTSKILTEMEVLISRSNPDYVCVQGDTTTALACSLAGFYAKVQVIHIEAGLRTNNIDSPFPEEVNRQLISRYATYHLCPSRGSFKSLKLEGRTNVFMTGNTSIDSLRIITEMIQKKTIDFSTSSLFSGIDFNKKIVLVTSHRRENHGAPLENICNALVRIAKTEDCQIVFPVHLNPKVSKPVHQILGECDNIFITPHLRYDVFAWLMSVSTLILTDSGSIQEEAPFLNIPLLILRDSTERQEIVSGGAARLVGTNTTAIVEMTKKCLHDQSFYDSFKKDFLPYGNGFACKETMSVFKRLL